MLWILNWGQYKVRAIRSAYTMAVERRHCITIQYIPLNLIIHYICHCSWAEYGKTVIDTNDAAKWMDQKLCQFNFILFIVIVCVESHTVDEVDCILILIKYPSNNNKKRRSTKKEHIIYPITINVNIESEMENSLTKKVNSLQHFNAPIGALYSAIWSLSLIPWINTIPDKICFHFTKSVAELAFEHKTFLIESMVWISVE